MTRLRYGLILAFLSTGLGIASTAGFPASDHRPTQVRLSWTASPKTSMAVVWQTAAPSEAPVVEYGTTEKLGRQSPAARATYPYETGVVYQAVLEGLKPGRRYHYRVGDSKSGFSGMSSFQTAPAGESDFLFTAFGDHGLRQASKTNVGNVLSENPAFHLVMGDLCYANGRQPIWDQYFEQITPLSSTIPFMPALGNHENERIGEARIGYIAYLTRLALPPPETHYSFDYGGARIISFNSDDFRNEDQMRWFVGALQKARADRRVRWLIVYQHHPLYSSNVRRLNNKPLIAAVREVLDRYKVDLVLAGHNHNYERSYPLVGEAVAQGAANSYRKGNGVVFVVSGGGGQSLYEFTPEMPAITAVRESVEHYLRVRVKRNSLQVEAIRTKDRSLLDSFMIRR